MNVKETQDIRGQTADSGVCATTQSLCECIVCVCVCACSLSLHLPAVLYACVSFCRGVFEQCPMTHAGMCRHSLHQTSNILQTFHKQYSAHSCKPECRNENRWLMVHIHGCTHSLTLTNSSRSEYASLTNEMGQAMGGRGQRCLS